ncbi:stress response protein NST1 [Benincasa hispida]|uniref:stress response protein NST1 n=1 Tax=Benincasa hispida TaxID=102211 RepID=UPI0019025102|nr:stress response protein NST1 [Benincasa hispida]
MSEISISKKGFGLSCVSNLFHFFIFLLSHPLYLSYFIFFFPYFLKLLSFLSPLFITTFLLLFAFFSLFYPSSSSDHHHYHLHHHFHQVSDSSKMGFLATTYQVVFDSLRPRTPEETDGFSPPMEELEAYKIVFETYTFGSEQTPYGDDDDPEVEVEADFQEPMENFPEEIQILQENPLLVGIETKTEELKEAQIENGDENRDVSRDETRDSSKAMENEMMKDLRKITEESSISSRTESSPWSSPGSFSSREYNSLGSYGSMRKEKEWRRTLACKLFEERHNSEGTEGMDSLWETYEKSESKKLQKEVKINGKLKKGKKIQKKEEEDEEEEDGEGQLCCLQALKFSAGKMNLGMGRPNLLKMTKALKGFGWLSRNGSRRNRLIH